MTQARWDDTSAVGKLYNCVCACVKSRHTCMLAG